MAKTRKKWRGRFLSIVLAALMVTSPLGMNGIAAHAQESEQVFDIGVSKDSVKATLSADGELSLKGAGAVRDFTPDALPFGDAARRIQSVTIAPGITSLGDYLFYNCGNIRGTLELPDGIVEFGDAVFSGASAEQAPKPELIVNRFTEAHVTSLKETPEPTAETAPAASEAPAKTEPPESRLPAETPSASPETVSREAGTGAEAPGAAAEPEESSAAVDTGREGGEETAEAPSPSPGPSASSSPEPSAVPAGTAAPGTALPTQTPDGETRYVIEKITEQKIGENLFFCVKSEGNRFYFCSSQNQSFARAAQEAGYAQAQSVLSATFDCGEGRSTEGTTTIRQLAVSGGMVYLPGALPCFSAPDGGSLFSYEFAGWTESRDAAGVIRPRGAADLKDRSDLYLIAAWKRTAQARLSVEYGENRMVLTVPEIEGYDISAVLWQECELPPGTPEDLSGLEEEKLEWSTLEGEIGLSYVRESRAGDEDRAFCCVLTVVKQSFLRSLFGAGGGEQVPLSLVRGTAAANTSSGHSLLFEPGEYSGAAISGTMGSLSVGTGDYAVVPSCGYTAAGVENLVFNGWEDAADSAVIYDPGDFIRPERDMTLKARWAVATVRYVDGTIGSGDAESNHGASPDSPYKYLVDTTVSSKTYPGAFRDFSGGTKYTNIVVVKGNLSAGTALPARSATITNKAPDGSSYDATLTLSGALTASADLRFENLRLSGTGTGEHSAPAAVFAAGHKLCFGDGMTTGGVSSSSGSARGLVVSGGSMNGNVAGSPEIVVQSGSYHAIYGGCTTGGNVSGGTLIAMSGSGEAVAVIGGGWYGGNVVQGTNRNGYGSEILLSGSAKAGIVAGGARGASGVGVMNRTHISIGGNARVEANESLDSVAKGFVAGSGLDAATEADVGNARGGTLVEIRENAYVSNDVFGGSGDAYSSGGALTNISTKGPMEVKISGGEVGGSVYGGGNQRASAGAAAVTVEGGTIAGSVYGGGSKGSVASSTVTLRGDAAQIGTAAAPRHVFAGGDQGAVTGNVSLTIEGGSVSGNAYGGGNLAAGSVGGTTSVTVTGGSVSEVYGGGKQGAVADSSTVRLSGTARITENVYGGGYSASVKSASVTIGDNAQIGGSAYGGGDQGTVAEHSRLTMEGGTVTGSVYGGGNLAAGTVGGDSEVVMTGGAAAAVYGGGNQGSVSGSASVSVSGTAAVGGDVCGGGYSAQVQAASASVGGSAEISGNVYGGGYQGAVTGNTQLSLSGGTVKKNLFGGSKGDQSSDTIGAVAGDSTVTVTGGFVGSYGESGFVSATGNVVGGGEFAKLGGKSHVIVDTGSGKTVGDTVYGGGYYAPVAQSEATVTSGEIGGAVFGAGLGREAAVNGGSGTEIGGVSATVGAKVTIGADALISGSVYGGGALGSVAHSTQVTVRGQVQGSVFGAGLGRTKDGTVPAGAVCGNVEEASFLTLEAGCRIAGSAYGGGDYGTLGARNTLPRSAYVVMNGGAVEASLFGGGSGSGSREDGFGDVTGDTEVQVLGGTLGQSVFGGGNRAGVAGSTHVRVEPGNSKITVQGGVYGGGNLPDGETGGFDNAAFLVSGDSEVSLTGKSGTNSASVGGSVFGCGNFTRVQGRRTVNITDYTGAMQSVQRADTANIISSNITFTGANDVVEEVTRYYSVARIDSILRLVNSEITVQKEMSEVAALGNFVQSGGSYAVSSSGTGPETGRSILRIYQGKVIQIKKGDVYGDVSGVLWLDIQTEEGSTDYGVSIQAGEGSAVGDGANDTGAFLKYPRAGSEALPLVSGVIAGQYSYWRLGGAVVDMETTISAVHESNGGTGLSTITVDLPTAVGSTVYTVAGMSVSDGTFHLVKPVKDADGKPALPPLSEGQTANNTFGLRLEAVNDEAGSAWTDLGSGSYFATQLPEGAADWNSGVEGVWADGSAEPRTGTLGGSAPARFTLVYNPQYGRFEGGTVNIVLKEYEANQPKTEETLQNTINLSLTLEGEAGGVTRASFLRGGKSYGAVSGTEPVSITGTSSLSAYFTTDYWPETPTADGMSLSLYQVPADGTGGQTPAAIPAGTRLVLCDFTSGTAQGYYTQQANGEESLPLSSFTSMGVGGSSYPGPVSNTALYEERLLVTVDFSGCAVPPTPGDYSLRLKHSAAETAVQAVSFTVAQAEAGTLSMQAEKTGERAVNLTLTPAVSGLDTRFADGAAVRLQLHNRTASTAGFPVQTKFNGLASEPVRHSDGSVTLFLPAAGASAVSLDFSQVSADVLTAGDYQFQAELFPRPGLQAGSDSGMPESQAESNTVRFEVQTVPVRAISAELADKAQRLVDLSEQDAVLEFRLSVRMESGDALSVRLYRKTGATPEDSSYTQLTDAESAGWPCGFGPVSGNTATATLTVPKEGTTSGTYRAVFLIRDADGATVAEEPYNFIVK